MSVVTGDRYLEKLVAFVDHQAEKLIDGTVLLKLNPAGLHYVHSRLEALRELENLLSGAPIDYLRAYVSDLGDYRALEQLRRILRLLTSVKVVSVLPPPVRDPTPISLVPFGRLKVLELRGCDLSTSAAKGLLELRHTLEKLICHNSTDALRHIFAPRIADVRYCPQWNRLSFVSCAFNRLVLMDESLQLLPAVETLDLSRNKFAKVDNLRKCTKLKYLDLGFNHLRTIAPFSEVSCNIVKLVLRNNALASLHGLENLKTLEGLDVSYNIISNFSELEFLAGLPFLQDLWLEGNPLCCARWYRAQVFTYFSHPDKLKLDGKEISTRDFWKRQIILASRQKQPANFGFYFPAKEDVEGDGSISKKRRKVSRLASIESEEESTCFSSDVESQSCDNEIQSKEENAVSDEEAEIVDLMNRVETMKKERSVLWLREFKEWMNHEAEKFAGGGACGTSILQPMRKDHVNNGTNIKNHGESSRYVVDSLQTSGDESSTHVIESETSFVDVNTESHGMAALLGSRKTILGHDHQKSHSTEDLNGVPLLAKNSHSDSLSSHKGHRVVENGTRSPLTAVDDTTESHSPSACPGSPPHYQRDILSRRHNLVEEILQLSAESYSIASSDSDTSSSGEEQGEFGSSYELDPSQNEKSLYSRVRGLFSSNICRDYYDEGHSIHATRDNKEFLFHSCAEQTSSNVKVLNSNSKDFPSVSHELEIVDSFNQEADQQEKRKSKRKMRRRVVAKSENAEAKKGKTENSNGDGQCKRNFFGSDVHEFIDKEQSRTPAFANTGGFSDDFIERYFNSNIADSTNNEVCRCYLHCDCILEPGSLYREREVALLLSSEKKLYVMLVGVAFEGSGSIVSLLASHRVEDVKEISVGIGLQFVRVYIEKGATYLFLTRNIEKSRQLLSTFQLFGPFSANDECSLISLEQVQVELFRKQICGGSKLSIFQYSMLLFSSRNNEDESWVLRSMFVSGGYVFVCVEDLKQFGSLSVDGSSHPYFSLDSCCSISDISELVVMAKEGKCSLAFKEDTAKLSLLSKTKAIAVPDKGNKTSGCLRWKLKWFSEESLLNFVALLKAIHAGVTSSSLLVTFTS